MRRLRLHSDTRYQRTIHILPTTDRWVEEKATTWGVSYSEAANRLLHAYRKLHQETETDANTSDNEIPYLVRSLFERFEEQWARGIKSLQDEVEKVKSNLYLLETMHDRAVALQGAQRHETWRREVTGVMKQRKGSTS